MDYLNLTRSRASVYFPDEDDDVMNMRCTTICRWIILRIEQDNLSGGSTSFSSDIVNINLNKKKQLTSKDYLNLVTLFLKNLDSTRVVNV